MDQPLNAEALKIKFAKTRWHLVPMQQVEEIGKVFTDGAAKYGDDNWKTLDRAIYEDALFRHVVRYLSGERIDKDSGSPHTAHIATNAMILGWFDEEESSRKSKIGRASCRERE